MGDDRLTISTSDGVRLACWGRGEGPPLVLVHGSATDRRCFDAVVGLFDGYRVVAYDRRGHGLSGGPAAPDIDQEIDDLVQVVDAVSPAGDRVLLLGYSYGALISLHAVARTAVPVARAVLYEPPMSEPGLFPAFDEVLRLVDEGDFDSAAALFVTSTFHLPQSVVEAMRRGPMWQVAIDQMPTLRAELPLIARAGVPAADVDVPPLKVLVGQEGGNPAFGRIAERICAAIPTCELARVPGLPHFAMTTEPASFAAAVLSHFETADDRRSRGRAGYRA